MILPYLNFYTFQQLLKPGLPLVFGESLNKLEAQSLLSVKGNSPRGSHASSLMASRDSVLNSSIHIADKKLKTPVQSSIKDVHQHPQPPPHPNPHPYPPKEPEAPPPSNLLANMAVKTVKTGVGPNLEVLSRVRRLVRDPNAEVKAMVGAYEPYPTRWPGPAEVIEWRRRHGRPLVDEWERTREIRFEMEMPSSVCINLRKRFPFARCHNLYVIVGIGSW